MRLEGIFIPNVTPFREDGGLDKEALSGLIDYWMEAGISGLAVNASTGEGPLLSREEKAELLELAVEKLSGRGVVIAGTGEIGTRETIELTRDARDIGADAALVITPYFYKPSDEEIYRHYSTLLSKVDIPVILYNVPKFTGYSIKAGVIKRIAEENSNLIGVKESGGDLGALAEIISLVGDRLSVLSGSGDTLLPALALGGRGGILAIANVIPEACVALYKAYKRGEILEAGRLQAVISNLNRVLVRELNQASALKKALNLMGRWAGYPRRPILPLSQAEEARVMEALGRVGVLKGEEVKSSSPK
ncbi:4-hydroxy-tetrahydrodipicolinate synthase [Candidatus Bathyarchaeota archaeon]|nr:4-hydroxy-tetrahydrodipicolinate synthase [Candidatus Bathyarchaeota archaeon]